MKATTTYSTTDYSKFTVSQENRGINPRAMKKLVRSLTLYGWLKPHPMHVVSRNGSLVIIDGQHRFYAARKLKMAVQYVVEPDLPDISIAEVNGAQTPWTTRDYVESYHNQGNPNYSKLLWFSEYYKFPICVCAKMLMGKNPHNVSRDIKEGKFKIQTLVLAELMASIIYCLKPMVSWATTTSFVNALIKSVKVQGFCPEHFVAKCQANPGMLIIQANCDAFLDLIEKIYNHRTRPADKLAIKFEATKNAQ
jgi:hypothetical protein